MPNPIIPVPKFPNVAQLPGVPQLIRANQAIGTVSLAVRALQTLIGKPAAPGWSIFDSSGKTVIKPDSYLAFSYAANWRVSDFPIQDGEFASYNKVFLPPEVNVRLAQGGTRNKRAILLGQIRAMAGSLDVFTIDTPEVAYHNYNLHHFVLHRMGREGAYYFADLELFFRFIQSVPSQYSITSANTANAQNPPALPSQNQGTQSPQLAVPAAVKQTVQKLVTTLPF